MHEFEEFLKLVCDEEELVEKPKSCCGAGCQGDMNFSELYNWPIKLTQIPTDDIHFDDCNLLLAADCTAFAYAQFHERFIKDKVALIFCPQDACSLKSRLVEILKKHAIHSFELVIMDKPCCESAVTFVGQCITESKRNISLEVVRISKDGEIV